MKNKKVKNAIRATAFVLLFAVIIYGLNGLFEAKWYDKSGESAIAKHLYELEDDSLEVLILGSSQVAWSINTVEFYEKYGIMTYGIGGGHNTVLLNYYWLLEALKHQHNIKTVMVDVSMVYNTDKDEDSNYLKNVQGMHLSKNKLNAIKAYYDNIDTPENEENNLLETLITYTITLNKYHSRWDSLDEDDFVPSKNDINNIMGYTPTSHVWGPDVTYDELIIDNEAPDTRDIYQSAQGKYLEKIIDECKDRGIQCVLIKTPKSSWTKTASEGISALAKEKGIDYLECTTDKAIKDIGLDFVQDFKDKDHLNVRGATKLADYLGKYLLDNNTYTDYREKDGIKKEWLDNYHKKADSCYLNSSLTPEEYLSLLAKRDYTKVIQSSADISKFWNDKLQKGIEANGFTLDVSQQSGKSFIAAVRSGKEFVNKADAETVKSKIKLAKGKFAELESKTSGAATRLENEKDFSYSEKGLRITAFDEDTGAVVSRATIYNSEEGLKIAIDDTF